MSIKFDLQTSFLILPILYVKIEFTIYMCCCALKYVFKYVLTVKDMSIYRFEAKKCMWVEAHLSQKRIEEIIYLDLPKDFLTQTVSLVSFVLFVSFFFNCVSNASHILFFSVETFRMFRQIIDKLFNELLPTRHLISIRLVIHLTGS